MGRHIRPASVFKTATNDLNNAIFPGTRADEPPWYKAMAAIPPAETLIRPIRVQHHLQHHRPTRGAKKPKNLYRPQQLFYLEDRLRTVFFKDHPWELARPRIVLEMDGKDYQKCDWSKGLQQPGIPLTGESVVQRQLWLMGNTGKDRNAVYDEVRKEFYRMRQAEEVERRVAVEEAKHVGAYFGKTRLEVGMQLEDAQFENWKVWAAAQVREREVNASKEIDTFGIDEEAASVEEEEAPEGAIAAEAK